MLLYCNFSVFEYKFILSKCRHEYLSNFDKIINIYDFCISHNVFPRFLQEFLDVTICPIHGTDTTLVKRVVIEKG